MTTINTPDDLIRIVRENPEFRDAMRRELLTEELLELPKRFADYSRTTDKKFDSIDARFDGVDQRFDGIDQRLDGIDQRLDSHDQRFDGIDQRLDRIEVDLGEVKGIALESKLYNRGISRIATLLKVRNSRRVRAAELDDNSVAFNRAIEEAEEQGILSEREYDRLLDTDMIVQCSRRGSSQAVYVAVEATYGVTNRDISKVKGSESALRKVFPDAEVHTVMYYVNDMPEDLRQRCLDQHVRLIQLDSLR